MKISRFDDAAAFLRHAGPLLREHAIDNNVMLGIAAKLIDEPWDDAVMLTVDEAGAPRIAALMTPPWRLIVSTGPAEAIPALAEAVRDQGPRPPGVVGLAAMAERFASAWTVATGEKAGPGTAMNLHIANRVNAPADVRGALRLAKATESEWVAKSFIEFAIAIDANDAERNESRKSAAAYLARGDVWGVGRRGIAGFHGLLQPHGAGGRAGRPGLHPVGRARPGLCLGGGGGTNHALAR